MNNEILIYLITLTLPLIKTKKNPKRMNLKKKKLPSVMSFVVSDIDNKVLVISIH